MTRATDFGMMRIMSLNPYFDARPRRTPKGQIRIKLFLFLAFKRICAVLTEI
jgi:hypothetical protein